MSAESSSIPAKWPYAVGLASVVLGAAALMFAPFSGATYIAMPGIMVATVWAFACRSPFRFAAAASVGLFAVGFFIGAAGIVLTWASGANGGNFVAQEMGGLVVLSAIAVLPLLGIVSGLIALLGTLARPGTRSVRPELVGGLD